MSVSCEECCKLRAAPEASCTHQKARSDMYERQDAFYTQATRIPPKKARMAVLTAPEGHSYRKEGDSSRGCKAGYFGTDTARLQEIQSCTAENVAPYGHLYTLRVDFSQASTAGCIPDGCSTRLTSTIAFFSHQRMQPAGFVDYSSFPHRVVIKKDRNTDRTHLEHSIQVLRALLEDLLQKVVRAEGLQNHVGERSG